MSRSLILIRHGQSVWNAQNRFTGRHNPKLTERGETQARALGQALRRADVVPDVVFTSALLRARSTARHILAQFESPTPKPIANAALNERDYGDLTGLNKDEARERFGPEKVHLWRRSLKVAPPGGESLADTAARAVPYLLDRILPALPRDGVCLVVAHGNSLRSLAMHLENLSADAIENLNLQVAEARLYPLDAQDRVVATPRSIVAKMPAYSLDMQDCTVAILNRMKAFGEPVIPNLAPYRIASRPFAKSKTARLNMMKERVKLTNPDFVSYRIASRPLAKSKTARIT